MKNIPIKLLEHYESETMTIGILVLIELKNGRKMGFTDVDRDVVFNETLFKKSSGISPSAISYKSAMSVNNLEFEGIMTDEDFTEEDIRAGIFSGAFLRLFRCNYMKIEDGVEILMSGWIGDITVENTKFSFEVRGLGQIVQTNVGRTYMPSCDANLGDVRCGILIENFTVTGKVEASNIGNIVVDSSRLEEEGWFNYGLFTFTSGENKGYSVEVKEFKNGRFEFQLPFFKKIEEGDEYKVYAGCDKDVETCKAKYNNILNFRGFPSIPLPSVVLDVGGS